MTNVNRAWVYLLPPLHILACMATAAFAATYVNTEWTYVVFADYPVSLVVVGLAWRYKWPLFPLFAIIGTLWWCLASLVVAFCWTRVSSAIRNSRCVKVDEYLHTEQARAYLRPLAATTRLIDGYESPLGMELLSTVDWLLAEGGYEANLRSIREGLAKWPGGKGAAQRKQRLFDDRLLGLALSRLSMAPAIRESAPLTA